MKKLNFKVITFFALLSIVVIVLAISYAMFFSGPKEDPTVDSDRIIVGSAEAESVPGDSTEAPAATDAASSEVLQYVDTVEINGVDYLYLKNSEDPNNTGVYNQMQREAGESNIIPSGDNKMVSTNSSVGMCPFDTSRSWSLSVTHTAYDGDTTMFTEYKEESDRKTIYAKSIASISSIDLESVIGSSKVEWSPVDCLLVHVFENILSFEDNSIDFVQEKAGGYYCIRVLDDTVTLDALIPVSENGDTYMSYILEYPGTDTSFASSFYDIVSGAV